MVFKLVNTNPTPGQGSNANRGFPAPGAGSQSSGQHRGAPAQSAWSSRRPALGRRSWFRPGSPQSSARGMPRPQNPAERRQPGEIALTIEPFGSHVDRASIEFSRGAPGVVQTSGLVLTNPIGAGVVATHRPQASYGPSGQYIAGEIWWTSQVIPTSVPLIGLSSPQVLAAILGPVNVQGVVRVNG
jgi:hypothetical protein